MIAKLGQALSSHQVARDLACVPPTVVKAAKRYAEDGEEGLLDQRAFNDVRKVRVVLHFLPPHCPDDNKIEHVWLELQANVTRNHRCRRMDELMVQVVAFLLHLQPAEEAQPFT